MPHHPVVHFEIGCKDRPATTDFYSKIFGWKITDGGPASMIHTGDDKDISGHISALGHEPHNYVLYYIQVEDIESKLAEIEAAGGRTMIPKNPVHGMGYFAWFNDVAGNTLGLWTPDTGAA